MSATGIKRRPGRRRGDTCNGCGCHAVYRPEYAALDALQDDADAVFAAWSTVAALMVQRPVHPALAALSHTAWRTLRRIDLDRRTRQLVCSEATAT